MAEEIKSATVVKSNILKTVITLLEVFLPAAVITVLMNYVFAVTIIQSASMEPTLMTGAAVVYDRLAYKESSDVQRGDIVMFWSKEEGLYLSKRVIGLPGDKVEFKDGDVVINGQFLDESEYIQDGVETNMWQESSYTVPEDAFFVLGDNRENSRDSRYFKNSYISYSDIRGRFKFIILTPKR